VVCCFTADDLIVDRLRTAGARLLRDVLLAAGGRASGSAGRSSSTTDGLVTDLRDRLTGAGMPVQLRVGDGGWPLDIAVADPRVPGRMLVAVDVDGPAFSSRACRERERNRPLRWERAGWVYCKVSALDLFNDPALEVARIKEAWERAMAEQSPVTDEGATGSVGSADVSDDQKPGEPAREPGSPAQDDPVLPTKAADDTDEGWGERESEDRDDQYRRDRPPHWD
jgi:hypothetical protein